MGKTSLLVSGRGRKAKKSSRCSDDLSCTPLTLQFSIEALSFSELMLLWMLIAREVRDEAWKWCTSKCINSMPLLAFRWSTDIVHCNQWSSYHHLSLLLCALLTIRENAAISVHYHFSPISPFISHSACSSSRNRATYIPSIGIVASFCSNLFDFHRPWALLTSLWCELRLGPERS